MSGDFFFFTPVHVGVQITQNFFPSHVCATLLQKYIKEPFTLELQLPMAEKNTENSLRSAEKIPFLH